MNKIEYIPGDLVMTNGVPVGTAKDVVYRVVSSDPSKTLELNNGTVLKGVVCLENLEGAKIEDKGFEKSIRIEEYKAVEAVERFIDRILGV